MARPRSEDRRNAILRAATRVIASEGLAASTAAIAKEAGVSNGSLFVYFETKAALFNQLYVLLKTDMATAATAGLPTEREPREQLQHMWTRSLDWALSSPEKRRALAQLDVSDDITEASHNAASAAFTDIAELLGRGRANGPMEDAPMDFALTLISAIADAAIDAILREPDEIDTRSRVAFGALWRVLAGSNDRPPPQEKHHRKGN